MDIVKSILHITSAIFTNIVFVVSMYYLILSFFGIFRFKDKKEYSPEKTFAFIVAAHNEEVVIQDIVNSLKQVEYPKDMYDIFVIADNCKDLTAAKARQAGALVYERFDEEQKGKGYALEWMFKNIFNMKKRYDSIVVLDADNLVSKNFLKVMNNKLCSGYDVVQGYLDSKNPKDSWITGSYSISFWTSNRMFQLARNNIGLSNQLGGTGFCINTSVLKELGWGATCLTEDLEFTCKLVLNDCKVGWAHEAVIYDEKPLTLKQSWAQRKRWMQGFADVASRYFCKLTKKGLKELNWIALDCALYSIQPIITILLGVAMVLNVFNYFVMVPEIVASALDIIQNANFGILKIGTILLVVLQFIYTPFVLFLDKKFDFKIFLYYLIYPLYALTWVPISVQGILNKNNKEWSHTVHTRSIKISELEKAN